MLSKQYCCDNVSSPYAAIVAHSLQPTFGAAIRFLALIRCARFRPPTALAQRWISKRNVSPWRPQRADDAESPACHSRQRTIGRGAPNPRDARSDVDFPSSHSLFRPAARTRPSLARMHAPKRDVVPQSPWTVDSVQAQKSFGWLTST